LFKRDNARSFFAHVGPELRTVALALNSEFHEIIRLEDSRFQRQIEGRSTGDFAVGFRLSHVQMRIHIDASDALSGKRAGNARKLGVTVVMAAPYNDRAGARADLTDATGCGTVGFRDAAGFRQNIATVTDAFKDR